MGAVYRARDQRLQRDVAIKVLLPSLITASAQARERFQREARAVAALQHPNICTIYDVGETANGEPFLVMELLQGETLQDRLRRGPFDPALFIDVAIALADGLDAAHRAGIIHRDIKPANILLTPHGPKILDFGLAKGTAEPVASGSIDNTIAVVATRTDPGTAVGTVGYMSPEQLRGEAVDERTDLFSLGLVLYEMAVGTPAFRGATTAVISAAILHSEPTPSRQARPDLPEPLHQVIAKSIEKDRHLRFQHASELRADLLRARRDSGSAPVATVEKPGGRGGAMRWAIAGAAVAAGFALAAWIYSSRSHAPALTDADTIVLSEFVNTTGDPVFDNTLRQGLSVQLQQSPFLRLMSDRQIQRTVALMGRAGERVTPAIAREVCQRTGSAAVLEGSIATLGSQYVLGLRAENCHTSDLIDQEQAQVARKEEVLNALGEMATRFRGRVGESLATVRSHERPLAEATTASIEALQAYTEGLIAIRTRGTAGAIPLLQRAVELDPSFAIAHATLGLAYSTDSETALAIASNTRAFALRDRASDPEKFFIEYVYERDVTGNLDKARQTAELWTQTYPRDVVAHGLLGGYGTQGTGRYEQTISASRRALALDPTEQFGYLNMAWAYIALDRYDEAARALREAADQHLDGTDLAIPRYMLGWLQGDAAAMERAFARTRGTPDEDTLRLTQALTLARSGRLREAETMVLALTAAIRQTGAIERAVHYETAIAIWDAIAGNGASARRRAAALLEASKARDIEYGAGFALAASGDLARAQQLAADLEARFPEDTLVRFLYVPTLRALVALDHHDPAAAIALLQPSTGYELGENGLAFEAKFGNLHSAYVRGLAQLASGNGREAAAEFQKILDHRGLVLADPLDAVARAEKARALALAGDRDAARAAYDDVLTLWKNADAGVPLVTRTRLERQQLD